MNDHRVDGWGLALISVLVVWGTVGCASSKKATRAESKANGARQEAPEPPPPPLQEELTDAPCGNPDWSRLPDEHAIDGDPDSSSPSDEKASPEKEESSNSDASDRSSDASSSTSSTTRSDDGCAPS